MAFRALRQDAAPLLGSWPRPRRLFPAALRHGASRCYLAQAKATFDPSPTPVVVLDAHATLPLGEDQQLHGRPRRHNSDAFTSLFGDGRGSDGRLKEDVEAAWKGLWHPRASGAPPLTPGGSTRGAGFPTTVWSLLFDDLRPKARSYPSNGPPLMTRARSGA